MDHDAKNTNVGLQNPPGAPPGWGENPTAWPKWARLISLAFVGLLVSSDAALAPSGKHELGATFTVRAGERRRFSIEYLRPETLD